MGYTYSSKQLYIKQSYFDKSLFFQNDNFNTGCLYIMKKVIYDWVKAAFTIKNDIL